MLLFSDKLSNIERNTECQRQHCLSDVSTPIDESTKTLPIIVTQQRRRCHEESQEERP